MKITFKQLKSIIKEEIGGDNGFKALTAGELIAILQRFDPSTPIYVNREEELRALTAGDVQESEGEEMQTNDGDVFEGSYIDIRTWS